MELVRRMFRKAKYFFRREKAGQDLRDEMEFHLHMRARKLQSEGVPQDEAPFAARRAFGNLTSHHQASTAAWGWVWWESLIQDFRQGGRVLRKAPLFTIAAILTLAVGLGINAAIFSMVSAAFLRPLPYPDPGQLISLFEQITGGGPENLGSTGAELGGAGGADRTEASVANLPDYRRAAAFAGLAHCELASKALTGFDTPEQITGEAVSANFFDVLQVAPERGRGFLPGDEAPGAAPVVIVTHDFWRSRMGGERSALEQTVMLDARPYQVIGILPAGFQSPFQLTVPDRIEFYTPAMFPASALARRADHQINVVGRLKTGVSIRAAQQELDAMGATLAMQYPATNANLRPFVKPLSLDLAQNIATPLMALLGASILIVLLTCVNVANLLLARAAKRGHESSVRRALGAGRFRPARQFLAESLWLAAGGCVTGLAFGWGLLHAVLVRLPSNVTRVRTATMDWRVFAAAAVAAALTGLVFGLAPAWQAARAQASESLKAAARSTASKGQASWGAALAVAQIALSLMLVIGAGLFLRSLAAAIGTDLGFQPERVVAMNIRLPDLRYPNADSRLAFFQRLEEHVRNLPGVQSVAYADRMPLRGWWGGSTNVDNAPAADVDTDKQAVSPGYFQTLGMAVQRGRLLAESDRDGQLPVAVVNQAFARQLLPGLDPIGRRLRLGPVNPWLTIVGVVNDIRRGGKEEPVRAQVYIPAAQTKLYPVRLRDFAVRSAGDPQRLIKAIQAEVLGLDKDQPVVNVHTMDELISTSLAQRRFETLLLSVFASVAVLLASIGIFGVLSNIIGQRTSEFGIRVAVGATPRHLMGLVWRQAGTWIGAGAAVGVLGALGLTRYLKILLFNVTSNDPWTYVTAVALLAAIALLAATIPAHKASRADPAAALRAG